MASPYLPTEQAVAQSSPEVMGIERQRKLADLLTAQGLNQPQGQMISGHYVPPSWTQQIAPMASVLAGNAVSERADKQQQQLAAALRAKQAGEIEKFGELEQQDKAAALRYALGTDNPILRSMAQEQLKGMKLGEGEVFTRPSLSGGNVEIQGGQKVAPEFRQSMQMLGFNKPIDQLTPQELQAINANIYGLKRAGATSINMPSEGERKAGFLSNILDKNLYQMQNALGVDPAAVKPNVPASVVEAITGPNLFSRSMKPAQRQIIEDSQLDVLDTALTLSTGAAYTREQLANKRDTYFPTLTDKPPAIAAKKQRLETLLDSAFIMAGRATPNRVSTSNPVTAPPPNATKDANVSGAKLPPGVSPQLWNVMTPEEKAAFK